MITEWPLLVKSHFKSLQKNRKERENNSFNKAYYKPKTPYQRVLENKDIRDEVKDKLHERFKALNPKKLLLEITRLGRRLTKN